MTSKYSRIFLPLSLLSLAACSPQQSTTTPQTQVPTTPDAVAPAPTPAAPVDAIAVVDNTAAPVGATLDTKALAGSFSDGESVLELKADGRYLQTLQAGGTAISTEGSWNADAGNGLLLDPNSKSAEDARFELVSNDELRSDDGSRTFRRVTASR